MKGRPPFSNLKKDDLAGDSENIGSGAHVKGNVSVNQGDFVGRDKIVQQPTRAIELRERRSFQEETLREALAAYVDMQERLRQSAVKPSRGRSPYKGLDYFEELDQGIFFGRDQQIECEGSSAGRGGRARGSRPGRNRVRFRVGQAEPSRACSCTK